MGRFLNELNIALRKAEHELKEEKSKAYASMRKTVQDNSKLKDSLAKLEELIKAKDAKGTREAFADFRHHFARFYGLLNAEKMKVKKALEEGVGAGAYKAVTDLAATIHGLETTVMPNRVKRVVDKCETTKAMMHPTHLLSQWEGAKKQFEAGTGTKKPSEKFIGVFRLSSGLEAAFKAVDLSTKKNDLKSLEKAVAAVKKAEISYAKVVFEKTKVSLPEKENSKDVENEEESDAFYQKFLLRILKRLREEADKALEDAKK